MTVVASQSGRAEWLANDAYDALMETIRISTEAVADGTHIEPAKAAELVQRWHWVNGLQRQAEIHARLAGLTDEESP
ncbi:hypothetical protein [Nocardia paucivorans]|uniref:hypothetical protein n=1 Tax=Nocardia paucivorans TaxID=114259 RepID=UPI0002D6337A|nr:hypothetical protein [Nocardia paucivorans]